MTTPLLPERLDPLQVIGTDVRGAGSATEACQKAGLIGWNSRLQKIRTSGNTTIEEMRAVVHDFPQGQVVAGVVGPKYQIASVEEMAEVADLAVDLTGGKIVTAHAFDRGKIVYLSVELPTYLKVGGTDPVDLYLNVINRFDGNGALIVSLDPVRAWCKNQLSYFRRQGAHRIPHRSALRARLAEAKKNIEASLNKMEIFDRQAERLAEATLTLDQFEAAIEKIIGRPAKNKVTDYDLKRSDLTHLFTVAPTNSNIRGTAWGGFMAFTEWQQYYKRLGRWGETRNPGGEPAERAARALNDDRTIRAAEKAYRVFSAYTRSSVN